MYESEDRAVFEDEISEPEYSKEMFENAEEMIYNIQEEILISICTCIISIILMLHMRCF
ncbi:MAG: hypothetical protein ACLRMX_05805 [Lachnospira eligens]